MFFSLMGMASIDATELLVGTSTIDITPELPIVRGGTMSTKVSRSVESPLTATALAIEGANGAQAIMISCDLVAIRPPIQRRVQELVGRRLSGFEVRKLVINATHSHTTPTLVPGRYLIPEGVTKPEVYIDFLVGSLADVAVEAWISRKPAGASWGLGHAVTGYSRLPTYLDGTTTMYGETKRIDFSHLEGFEDQTVNVLFFWDESENLIAMAINLASPAQTIESHLAISADYWHDVRLLLREQYSSDLAILGWCSAAGELTPRPTINKAAEERMRNKRGLTETQEVARRITNAVAEAYEVAKDEIHYDLPFVHKVEDLGLPMRIISDEQVAESRANIEKYSKQIETESISFKDASNLHRHIGREKTVVERYNRQKRNPNLNVEIHALRLGDIAIATNSFELFVNYGLRIKARSEALQTFVVQLASTADIYLPTKHAIEGGGYGAIITVSIVGPEGGKILVDNTVELINSFWSQGDLK